jgi:hypothetical protein
MPRPLCGPSWARKQDCPLEAEPLGEDYAAAVERAEHILLHAFDSWRSGSLTDMVPACPVPGSFDWLVSIFKAHQKWKEIDHKTQRLYEQGLALFASHELKDGTRAGSKQISHFSKGFVDAIYAKLLVVEEEDADGNIVEQERRRFAIKDRPNYCRRSPARPCPAMTRWNSKWFGPASTGEQRTSSFARALLSIRQSIELDI